MPPAEVLRGLGTWRSEHACVKLSRSTAREPRMGDQDLAAGERRLLCQGGAKRRRRTINRASERPPQGAGPSREQRHAEGQQLAAGERRMLCQGGAKSAPTDKHPSERKAAQGEDLHERAKGRQSKAEKEGRTYRRASFFARYAFTCSKRDVDKVVQSGVQEFLVFGNT